MRRCLLLVPLLAYGCGPQEPETVGRADIPRALIRPVNLKPDPPRPKVAPGDPSVAGVCRVSEGEVACWDITGKPDPKLSRQAKADLRSRQTPYSVAFGKKFRLIAVDLPPASDTTYEISAKTMPEQGQTSMTGASGRAWFGLTTPPGAKSTDLDVVRQSRREGEAPLELRNGATVSVGEGKLTVASVGKIGPGDPMPYSLWQTAGWKVVARRSSGPDSLTFEPIDRYDSMTGKGQRAHFDPKTGKFEAASSNAPRIINMRGTGVPEGGFIAILDRDPATVKTIPVRAVEQRRTTIPAVPLDPQSR